MEQPDLPYMELPKHPTQTGHVDRQHTGTCARVTSHKLSCCHLLPKISCVCDLLCTCPNLSHGCAGRVLLTPIDVVGTIVLHARLPFVRTEGLINGADHDRPPG